MGQPKLIEDERFCNPDARVVYRKEVNEVVALWVSTLRCEEVVAALGPQGADVPCARVADAAALLQDPALRARGMIERHPHPVLGEIVLHGNPLRFSDAQPRARALAPALGEHTREVLAEIGLTQEALDTLAQQGVI